jgi:outer membrane protein assembly factor BamB
MLVPAVSANSFSFSMTSLSGGARSVNPITLTSPNAQYAGNFGWSEAINGSTVVVGAPSESFSGMNEAGHAYGFNTATGALLWTLLSPNAQSGGIFGLSVAISSAAVVVGAPEETGSNVSVAGHAYVFSAKTGKLTWTLTSPNPQTNGYFGSSVAISGSTVVVGAPGENAGGQTRAGHAYVFSAKTGKLAFTLASPNAQFYGAFGNSVAISGATIAVGAYQETASGQGDAGRAYTFSAKTGNLMSTLTSPNVQVDGYFGSSVGISSTTVVVGAPDETAAGKSQAGHAYTFNSTTGAAISTLTSLYPQKGGAFGISVAISDTTVVVGAPIEKARGYDHAGHSYTFNAASGALISTLASPNAQAKGYFGWAVAIGGTRAVIGAIQETAAGYSYAGHAYVF